MREFWVSPKVDFVNIVPGCVLIDFSRVHNLSWKSSVKLIYGYQLRQSSLYQKKIVREWKPASLGETFAGRNFGVFAFFAHFCESLSPWNKSGTEFAKVSYMRNDKIW